MYHLYWSSYSQLLLFPEQIKNCLDEVEKRPALRVNGGDELKG